MRDMFLGTVILGWTYLAAHAGTVHVTGLVGMVQAGLQHVLGRLG